MRAARSLPPEYFERMFAGTPDPWEFETSPYEQAKYEHTLDALGERRFRRALEIGCANGVLTERLAGHCEEPDRATWQSLSTKAGLLRL